MIVIKARAKVKADQLDEARAACLAMSAATAEEEANISYTFSADLADPTLIHLFEEWENEEGLQEHFATSHMGEFIVALGTVIDGDMPTTKYEVSSFGPL